MPGICQTLTHWAEELVVERNRVLAGLVIDSLAAGTAFAGPSEFFDSVSRTYRVDEATLKPFPLERGPFPYIWPIERFRTKNGLGRGPLARRFLSSGTTSTARSEALFSQDGLLLYKIGSVGGFATVLEQLTGTPIEQSRGLSLIPDTKTWPDSSLAQMVHWIGEVAPVTYSSKENFLSSVKEGSPTWIFATGYHLVDLVDSKVASELPKQTLLFETGGTKGRTRSVSRPEYMNMLQKGFQIPRHRIVSEYGMAELASQAYEFGDEQRFRFPSWVETAVIDRPLSSRHQGEGCLIVHDRLRIDCPFPIRTEDLVSLDRDGSFDLLGRARTAPLKGCSLLAEAADGL